jgi:F-type H+-transporting ATPase subunit a
VPKFLGEKVYLPSLVKDPVGKPLVAVAGVPVIRGQLTKFMVLEVVAALIVLALFTWLARKAASGARPMGKLWNMLESIVVFVRDEIAKPAIGEHDMKRFLPFLLTLFFFVLTLNLLGMLPFLGSATGSLAVTAVFAVLTFGVVVGSGMKKMGVVGFLKAQLPHIDLEGPLKYVLLPGIWLIEMFGLFVKHFVLAVRLFANMLAGHLVLAVFIGFIGVTSATALFWGVAPISILATIAFSVLELFVAVLQAYVFTFLAALFIGSAQHAH